MFFEQCSHIIWWNCNIFECWTSTQKIINVFFTSHSKINCILIPLYYFLEWQNISSIECYFIGSSRIKFLHKKFIYYKICRILCTEIGWDLFSYLLQSMIIVFYRLDYSHFVGNIIFYQRISCSIEISNSFVYFFRLHCLYCVDYLIDFT